MPKKMTQAKKKCLKQKIKTHLHNTHFLTIFNTKKVSCKQIYSEKIHIITH